MWVGGGGGGESRRGDTDALLLTAAWKRNDDSDQKDKDMDTNNNDANDGGDNKVVAGGEGGGGEGDGDFQRCFFERATGEEWRRSVMHVARERNRDHKLNGVSDQVRETEHRHSVRRQLQIG